MYAIALSCWLSGTRSSYAICMYSFTPSGHTHCAHAPTSPYCVTTIGAFPNASKNFLDAISLSSDMLFFIFIALYLNVIFKMFFYPPSSHSAQSLHSCILGLISCQTACRTPPLRLSSFPHSALPLLLFLFSMPL